MEQETVRKTDELGRIVIPAEMRSALGWDEETKISISMQGERIVLQAYRDRCFLCGSEENIKTIYGKHVCQKCIDKISR